MRKIINAVFAFIATLGFSTLALAAEEATASTGGSSSGILAFSAAIAIGLGALGGALGQSRAASAALEGIARNPGAAGKIQTPMIIALALMESLVLLAFVVAYLLQGKI